MIRTGGRFVIGMRERSDAAVTRFPAEVYRFYSTDELSSMLRDAGYGAVNVINATSGDDLRIVVATTRSSSGA